jgi:LPS-assembly protein
LRQSALLGLLAAVVVFCAPAAALDLPPATKLNELFPKESTILPTDIPIQVSAERLSFDYESKTYTAFGNVSLSQGNMRLRADSIQYSGETGMLTAKGRVILRRGGDVLEADKVSVKMSDATGVLYNGKLLLTRQNVYLEGKKLEKSGESSYRIEDGSFTTCNGVTPDWRITGKDLDVTLEGYGTLKHGFFYVKDIPVFYIPWLAYPVKRNRQTGFLMPNLSNSTLRGFDMRLPFFLALSPSADATIIPRICTNRALQTSLEFRYIPTDDFKGRFYGEYTYDWVYGGDTTPKTSRFFAAWLHDQALAGGAELKANGNWVSDRDYFELWGGRFDRRNRVRYLESNAVVSRQWDNLLVRLEARHFDNLDAPDNAVTVQNLPIITGVLFNQQIPWTPFYFSSNIAYDHYFAPIMRDQWFGTRLQVNARLSLPISLGPYLKLEPSATYFAKAYAADYYVNRKSAAAVNGVRTDLYQVNGDVYTDLYSVFDAWFLGFQRVKHTVRPRFTWTYRPPAGPDVYPYFDETDRVEGASLVTAELLQTLTGRIGQGQYLDFMKLNVTQGFDLAKEETGRDAQREKALLGVGWTNTLADLTFRPHTLVDLVAHAEYDPVANRARKYSLGFGLMDHRGDTLRVFHEFAEGAMRQDLNRQTNVNLHVRVADALECFFENQFTHQFNFSYFTSLGLVYHPQCWNVELKYSAARAQDPLTQQIKESDQTVFLTVSLYGLGQVYRMTREWGETMGASAGLFDSQPR